MLAQSLIPMDHRKDVCATKGPWSGEMVCSKEVMLEVSAARVEVLVRLKIQIQWRGFDWPANFPSLSALREMTQDQIFEVFSC